MGVGHITFYHRRQQEGGGESIAHFLDFESYLAILSSKILKINTTDYFSLVTENN